MDFFSVSPHTWGPAWQLRRGHQLNVVPGLNGLRLADMPLAAGDGFTHRYVTPCAGQPETMRECLEFVYRNPGWRLGCQAHLQWGLP